MNTQYPHLPIYETHQISWRNSWEGPTVTKTVYSVIEQNRETRLVTRTELLWLALCRHFDRRCDTVHYQIRGLHRLQVESGMHDDKRLEFIGPTFAEIVEEAAKTLIPEYLP